MKKTLLAIIIMAFALVTSAQDNAIIFTDFEPDSIRVLGEENCMDTIFIDIDNDGTMDLAAGFYEYVFPSGNTSIYSIVNCINDEWQVALLKQWLNGDYYIINDPNIAWYDEYVHTHWPIMAGARKKTDDGYTYAWFYCTEIQEPTPRVFYFDKMAYCTLKDYPLEAGQTYAYDMIDDHHDLLGQSAGICYPNPSGGMVSVVLPEGASGASVELFSLDGRLVMSEPWVTGGIDISRLATGIYIMRVATDNGVTFEEKVVRE